VPIVKDQGRQQRSDGCQSANGESYGNRQWIAAKQPEWDTKYED
jgi:hypothetical protein